MHESKTGKNLKVSRRSFLSGTGKIIGFGVLSRFIMLGDVQADSISLFAACNQTTPVSCTRTNPNQCSATQRHECSSNTPNNCGPAQGHSCKPTDSFSCSQTQGSNNCTGGTQLFPE